MRSTMPYNVVQTPSPPLPEQGQQICSMDMNTRLKQTAPLAAALFLLWIVLSGKFDALHLTMGAVSSVWISLGTQHLLVRSPAIGPAGMHPFTAIPWLRFLGYIPWLFWQIVISSVQVAYVVLHPRMPMQPTLTRFRSHLPHDLARLTLANSITLTPGTVTIDIEGDEFVIHALTAAGAESLDPPHGNGDMQRRVAALFASQP